MNSDIPSPYDVHILQTVGSLPEDNLISEKEKEEIRDWLL
jgi:hypothetical protein